MNIRKDFHKCGASVRACFDAPALILKQLPCHTSNQFIVFNLQNSDLDHGAFLYPSLSGDRKVQPMKA
jgi:hypothetical protein